MPFAVFRTKSIKIPKTSIISVMMAREPSDTVEFLEHLYVMLTGSSSSHGEGKQAVGQNTCFIPHFCRDTASSLIRKHADQISAYGDESFQRQKTIELEDAFKLYRGEIRGHLTNNGMGKQKRRVVESKSSSNKIRLVQVRQKNDVTQTQR